MCVYTGRRTHRQGHRSQGHVTCQNKVVYVWGDVGVYVCVRERNIQNTFAIHHFKHAVHHSFHAVNIHADIYMAAKIPIETQITVMCVT